jgi:hypothetical protein
MRKCNLSIIALLLLLAFTQKLGLRLLLHNKYHSAAKQTNGDGTAAYYQVQCDCLDEALMPLSKAETVDLPAPLENHIILHSNYGTRLSSAVKIFHALRGPPEL